MKVTIRNIPEKEQEEALLRIVKMTPDIASAVSLLELSYHLIAKEGSTWAHLKD